MSLISEALGLMANAGAAGPLQGALRSILGGGTPAQGTSGQGTMDQGTSGQGTPGQPTGGNLSDLISGFEQAGLGHIVQSWIGNGSNQPVSPQQLQSVFGNDRVQSIASQSGVAPQDLLSQLSQHLPELINRLTPNGRPPAGSTWT